MAAPETLRANLAVPAGRPLIAELAAGHPLLERAGRTAFALAVIGFGAHHLVARAFATRGIPAWPLLPGNETAWALAVGVLLVVAGVAIFADWRRRAFALAAAALWGSSLLVVLVPRVVANWR